MKKRPAKEYVFLSLFGLFFAVELFFYITIVFRVDHRFPFSISYASIIAAAAMAAVIAVFSFLGFGRTEEAIEVGGKQAEGILGFRCRKAEALAGLTAMLFTLGADYFLVILWADRKYLIAVILFMGAQLSHFVRLQIANRALKTLLISLGVRVAFSMMALIVVQKMHLWNPLNALAVVYFVQLLGNAIDSAILISKEKRGILALIGFLLFALCDITVGLSFLGESNLISGEFMNVISYLTWVFYLPSQVLIVSSFVGRRQERKG